MNDSENRTHRILKSSLGPAAATLASRILGLVRVMLEARVLGGSALASAWHFSFAVPNLLRRLFGEGALGTALIPLISESDAKEGRETMRRQLAVVFTALGLLLAVIVLIVSGASLIIDHCFLRPEWPLRVRLTLRMLPLLMPYGFFMCLVGVIGAVLNTQKQFFLPALGALFLNLFIIGGLLAGFYGQIETADTLAFLKTLSWLVLTSGFVQLLMLAGVLAYYRSFPLFRGMASAVGILKPLWRLALPGLIGGAALQVSFLADRTMAMWIGDQAIPALTYVDRLIDLPIGIFALSLGQVLMASLSHSAIGKEYDQMSKELLLALRHVYFICIPMGMAVIFLWNPMLTILCRGGNFTESDLQATRLVAIFYGAGIPFFCSSKVLLPAFHSRKEMIYPLRVSLTTIALNVLLNFALMFFLKQGGIALATVISTLTGNFLLLWKLKKEGFLRDRKAIAVSFFRSVLLAAAAACAARFVCLKLHEGFGTAPGVRIAALAAALAVMGGVYFGLSRLFRAPETGELLALLHRRSGQKKAEKA